MTLRLHHSYRLPQLGNWDIETDKDQAGSGRGSDTGHFAAAADITVGSANFVPASGLHWTAR